MTELDSNCVTIQPDVFSGKLKEEIGCQCAVVRGFENFNVAFPFRVTESKVNAIHCKMGKRITYIDQVRDEKKQRIVSGIYFIPVKIEIQRVAWAFSISNEQLLQETA